MGADRPKDRTPIFFYTTHDPPEQSWHVTFRPRKAVADAYSIEGMRGHPRALINVYDQLSCRHPDYDELTASVANWCTDVRDICPEMNWAECEQRMRIHRNRLNEFLHEQGLGYIWLHAGDRAAKMDRRRMITASLDET